MEIIKKLFYSLVFAHCLNAEPFASDRHSILIPDSLGDVKWHPVVYEEEQRSFKGQLPGSLEETINNDHLCFFHSTYREAHYGIYFNPALRFDPPSTEEEFIDSFNHLKNAQITALKPLRPPVLYLLQIHIFNKLDATLKAIFRVYATENTLYLAMVEGGDFAFTDDFFHSIRIEK